MRFSKIRSVMILAIGLQYVGIAQADLLAEKASFSVDPASPSGDGDLTPDDVLRLGPSITIQGSTFGLMDSFPAGSYDNLADFSSGRDAINHRIQFYFSVDRLAVGLPGSAVYERALPFSTGAAGDVYVSMLTLGSNGLAIEQQELGLTPGFFGDDLDGLSLNGESPLYFAIDALSASNQFGAGTFANDIFFGNLSSVFANGESDIGLNPFDVIDGLLIVDRGTIGTLDPGIDRALFSLSSFSPSTFTYTGNTYQPGLIDALSPADILVTDFRGKFSLWASAADIGLRPEDNVDALATTMMVPEPATWQLCAAGVLGLFAWRSASRRSRLNLSFEP